MRYDTAAAFRRALEQRLGSRAKEKRVPVLRLRKLVTFDRLLARLETVAPGHWVLKGALALEFRFGEQARMTMDVDLSGLEDAEAVASHLREAQRVELQDFFVFRMERTAAPLEGGAVRYRAEADLGGRAGGRAKDLVDLLLILSISRMDGRRLRLALEGVFAARRLHPLPVSLPPPPPEWKTAYSKLAGAVGFSEDLGDRFHEAALFLDPVLAGDAAGVWNPAEGRWDPTSA